jgi:hypothetical protein
MRSWSDNCFSDTVSFKGLQKEPAELESVARMEDRTMRKLVSELDDAHRAVLLEWADLGTAISSAGLIVRAFRAFVSLFT